MSRSLRDAPHAFYAVVHNIPKSYHSRDLRRFFEDFVEGEKLLAFHFLHRPEQKTTQNEEEDGEKCDLQ